MTQTSSAALRPKSVQPSAAEQTDGASSPAAAQAADSRRLQKFAMVAVLLVALATALMVLLLPRHYLAGSNHVMTLEYVAQLSDKSGPLCVDHVTLPPDAGFVELEVGTYARSNVRAKMTVRDAGGKFLGATIPAAFGDGARVRFRMPTAERNDLTLCISSLTRGARVAVTGERNGALAPEQNPSLGEQPVDGDIALAYISAERRAAIGQVANVFERASLFRPAWVGPWTYYLVFACALLLLAAAFALALRVMRMRGPPSRRMFAAIAVIAFCNAMLWALVTPAFNAPDELAHFTYVETLAAGQLPDSEVRPGEAGNSYKPSTVYASELTAVPVIQRHLNKPPWSKEAEAAFFAEYDRLTAGPDTPYGLTPANAYSPAYYLPAVAFYKLGSLGNIFDKLLLVRVWSALLVAITVIFVMLFVMELVPRRRWAGPMAGLSVAFLPMVVHLGGAVSTDNLMMAACAATLWLGARVLMRCPTLGGVLLASSAFALAVIAKPAAAGLALPLAFAYLVAIWRSERPLSTLGTCALGSLPPALVLLLSMIFFGGSATAGVVDPTIAQSLHPTTPKNLLLYLWQWYLPSVGGMPEFFVGTPPALRIFFGGFLADFNSLDTRFPLWVYALYATAGVVLLVLGARALWQRRAERARLWPLVVYPLLALLGTLAVIHGVGFLLYASDGQNFAQGRYLFPALGVFGLYVAAAMIGAGRRWAGALGGSAVIGLAVLNIAGMAISLARFYA